MTPVVHDRDAVGHGKGLFLVVGHKDKGDAELALQVFEVALHLFAQFEIQGAEGFVQQEHGRPVDKGAGQGHALLLSAGQSVGHAFHQPFQLHQAQGLGDALFYLVLGQFLTAQPEGHVVVHVHVREQGVALENRVHFALVRGQLG